MQIRRTFFSSITQSSEIPDFVPLPLETSLFTKTLFMKPKSDQATTRSRIACLLVVCLLNPGLAKAHGSFHERIAGFSKLIESQPQDARLYLKRGEVYRQHEEWDKALADCDTARKLDPAIDVDLLRGRTLLESGSPQLALPLLIDFLKRHPDEPQALLCRARAYSKLNQPAEAIADYRACLKHTVNPEPDLIQETADALAAQGSVDEAVQVLSSGVGKLGPVPSLLLRAMDLEISIRDFDAALTRVDAMQKSAPRPEPWMAKRASILAQADRIPESLAAWQALADHLASLPNLERGSHAMSKLAQDAKLAITALKALPPPPGTIPAKPLNPAST